MNSGEAGREVIGCWSTREGKRAGKQRVTGSRINSSGRDDPILFGSYHFNKLKFKDYLKQWSCNVCVADLTTRELHPWWRAMTNECYLVLI